MRKRIILFGVQLLLLILWNTNNVFSDSTKSPTVNWRELLDKWADYLYYPTSENAAKVREMLPDSGHVEYTNTTEEQQSIDSIFNEISMLERQIISGDTNAVALAFRLYSLADGAFAETLDIILGSLIRIKPDLFLYELKLNRIFVYRLDALTGNFGEPFIDRERASELENRLRISALKTVTTESLVPIRDECIDVLTRSE